MVEIMSAVVLTLKMVNKTLLNQQDLYKKYSIERMLVIRFAKLIQAIHDVDGPVKRRQGSRNLV